MSLLYITADKVGDASGGGLVTAQELRAMREFSRDAVRDRKDASLSHVRVLARDELNSAGPEPWKWDQVAYEALGRTVRQGDFRIAHFYSGTFPLTTHRLKGFQSPITYTIAAHDRGVSKREHEELGLPFPYPHLTEEKLWRRYIEGYKLANVIVCPSTVAEKTVRAYGPDFEHKDIRVIPHGADAPEEVRAPPKTFVVGYLGSYGADKGVRYLLEAWKKLDYKDGSLLVLAGGDSPTSGRSLLSKYGGGAVRLAGWQKDVKDFYGGVSLYVQPSATEGFGIEVVEAMAHGRMALCSKGAGAQDAVPESWTFAARDAGGLARAIDGVKKKGPDFWASNGSHARRELAPRYAWDKIRDEYKALWAETLGW